MTAVIISDTEDINATGGDVVLSEPASLAVNDLLLAAVSNAATTPATPGLISGLTDLGADAAGDLAARAMYRVATGSEGPTYTSTVAEPTDFTNGKMLRITGHDPADPIDGENAATTAGATSLNFPPVTTTVDNCLAVAVVNCTQTFTATPTGWTLYDRYDGDFAAVYTQAMPVAGSTGTANQAFSASGAAVIHVVTINPATLEQEGFRWRHDDGSETTATWRQAQDTNDTAALDTQVRLRALINASGDVASTQYRLEYKEDSEAVGLWRPIGQGLPGPVPTIVGWGSAALTASASPSVNLSSGSWVPAENDIVALQVASTTVLASGGAAGWANCGLVNSDAHGLALLYHVVSSGEAGGSTTFTATGYLSATETGNVLGVAIRGVDPNAVLHSSQPTFGSGNTVTPSVLAAIDASWSGTPTKSNCLILRAVCQDSTGTYTTPAAHTSVVVNNTNQVNQMFARDAPTTAGVDVAAVNVTPDAGDEYCSVTMAFAPPFLTAGVATATSTQYADGAATTVQLAAPSGKTTSDFDAGVMVEGLALATAVDITVDDYTEIEWALKPQTPAVNGDIYQFRVTANGTALTTYTVTPQLTISSGGGGSQTLTGSVTAAGALARSTSKTLAGSSTPAGILRKTVSRVLAGSSTPGGTLRKAISKTLAGASTPVGVLVKAFVRVFTGSVSGSGAVAKSAAKTLAGSSTPAGALSLLRSVVQALTGSITGAGTAARSTSKAATGSTAPTGDPNQAGLKGLDGTVTGAGSDTKAVSHVLAGGSTPAGTLSLSRVLLLLLNGAVTVAGALSRLVGKVIGGSSAATGARARDAAKGLSGALTPEGEPINSAATAFVGSVTPVGTDANLTGKATAGSTTPSGALSALRVIGQLLDGTITAVGSVAKEVAKLLTGSTTPTGVLLAGQNFIASFAGAITAVGAMVRDAFKGTTGELIPAGDPNNETSKGLAGSSTPTGALGARRIIAQLLDGAITAVGTMLRDALKGTSGELIPAGDPNGVTSKGLAGSTSPSGNLSISSAGTLVLNGVISAVGSIIHAVSKAATGSTAPEGVPSQQTDKGLDGTASPTGDLTSLRLLAQTLTGTIDAAGSVVQAVAKLLAGSITPEGALLAGQDFVANLTGTITAVGVMLRDALKGTTGELIPTGDPNQETAKGLAGASAPSGTLSISSAGVLVLNGVISVVGAVVKAVSKAATGATAPEGAPSQQADKGLDGEITPIGDLTFLRLLFQVLTGTITATASLARDTFKSTTGSTLPAGTPSEAVDKGLDGSVTGSGSLLFGSILTLLLTGSIEVVGGLARSVTKGLAGAVTGVGALAKLAGKLVGGVITPSGTLGTVGGVPNVPGDLCLTLDIGRLTLSVDTGCAAAMLEAGSVVLEVG